MNSSIKNHKKIKSFSLIRDESNTFLFTKSKLKQNFIGDSDNIVFIGQPLIEAKIITLNELNSLIKEVALRFKNQTIYYFPHRWEQNTSNYSFPKNIKILDNNNPLPIELLLNSKNLLPKIVLSFYSTALITLKLIYLDQTSFSAVSTEKLLSIDKVNNAYKYVKDYGISTIEL